MGTDDARNARALARAGRFQLGGAEASTQTATECVALCTTLSRWAHELSGQPFPSYERAAMPVARSTTRGR